MNVNDTAALLDWRSVLKRGLQLGAIAALDPFASISRAEPRPTAGKAVEISSGKVRGKVHDGIHAFKGIPYSAPTGGKMRFMAPAKPEPWSGVRNCFTFGHQSPQNMNYVEVLAPQANGAAEGYDEDCLCLNVWTPDPSTSKKRPVMFWCHGGGYAQESGSWPWVDGESLSRRGDVVVVTINHRLNLFGYFHLGDIGGEKYAASGNAGMLDLVAGLTWVLDNIAQFGGDPGEVMIFGESGGGAKVSMLLAMPSARGLFHRTAIQSGPGLRANTRDTANALTKAMLAELNIGPDRIDDLQSVPTGTLLSAMKSVQSTPGVRAGFGPVLDPKILPAHPFDPVAPAISSDIPLIIGCNRTEQTFFPCGMTMLFTSRRRNWRSESRCSGRMPTLRASSRRIRPPIQTLLQARFSFWQEQIGGVGADRSVWPNARLLSILLPCICTFSLGSPLRSTASSARLTRRRSHLCSITRTYRSS
jgi:carboxylesterase type B